MINISSLKQSITLRPPKLIIYGPSKIGKSTFASQSPNPIVLDLENGMESINVTKYKAKKFSEIMEFMRALYSQEHEFKYLIVDSIDWLEKMMINELCHQHNARTLSDKDCKAFLYGGAERLLLTMWNQFIVGLDFLHQEKNMGIILIAHPQIKKFEDPLTASYDQYSIKLEKKSGERIKEWVDCILFATLKVKTEQEKKDFGGVVKRGMGAGRVIYTENRPSFEAGNRFKLPFEMECNWQSFYSHFLKYTESIKKICSLKEEKPFILPNSQPEESNEVPPSEHTTLNLISEHQVNFIKRIVTPERLENILKDYNISCLEDMEVKDYHHLNDMLRLESLPPDYIKQKDEIQSTILQDHKDHAA